MEKNEAEDIQLANLASLESLTSNKFHFTDWNQVFTKATTVSNGDPLASSFFYVPSMLFMYETADLIRRFLYT